MQIDVKTLEKEYLSGKSVPEIASDHNWSQWTVYKLMRKNNIPRRSFCEINRIRFDNKPLSFRIANNLSRNEEMLRVTGLMIYWAEGSKRTNHTVDLANSDPSMILLFLKFIKTIYKLDEGRLHVLLYCYSNQNQVELMKYWSELTHIPLNQFSKPYIRNDYNLGKNDRMPYGLVHIRYSDKKLLQQILKDIAKLTNKMLGW
jgi:hypothetical protein